MSESRENLAERVTAGVTFAARLAFEDIHHVHDDGTETLRGVTLAAEPGEVLCLLGPSGSGKTTLLRIAAGIETQRSGSVFLNDKEIAGPKVFVPPEKRSIGLVFQDFALFPHMTISENVRYGLTALSRQEAEREAAIALSRVGLEGYAGIYPHALSGGEQQRVALARALAPRPAVLLMDEPFSGLDSRLKDSVRAETLALLRQSRATAIVVTHDAEEAMRMGDRIALLNKGRLVQVGSAEDLYESPADLFVAGFFSELNQFDASVSNGQADTPVGRFPAPRFGEGAAVTVAIRLTGFKVRQSGGEVPARIVSRRYLGLAELLDLAVPGFQSLVRVRIRRGDLTTPVQEISLDVDKTGVMVFERKPERA